MIKLRGLGKLSLIAILVLSLCISSLPALADNQGNGSLQSQDLLVAANYEDSSLVSIDPVTLQQTSYITLDFTPVSIAISPATMYAAVLSLDPQNIAIVNISSKEVVANIPLVPYESGGLGTAREKGIVRQMFWSKDGMCLYVCTDRFFAVITRSYGTYGQYVAWKCYDMKGEGSSVAMSPNGSAIILFHKINDERYIIDRFNTTPNDIEKTVYYNDTTFPSGFIGPITYSNNGMSAYTIMDGRLYTINNSTLSVRAANDLSGLGIPSSPANRMNMVTDPSGKHLYMLYASSKRPFLFRRDKILAYDLTNNTMRKFDSEGRGIGNIALSTDGSLIYAANYCGKTELFSTISVLNASTGEIIKTIDLGLEGPYDVEVVPVQKAVA